VQVRDKTLLFYHYLEAVLKLMNRLRFDPLLLKQLIKNRLKFTAFAIIIIKKEEDKD